MEKRADEKILDYINEMEAKEARKDIKSGPVKIGNRYYEFEETDFLDEKIKMYIPKDFEDMSEAARKFKYPGENRPEIIKCNEDGSIAITFKIINSLLDENHVEELKDVMMFMNKRLNPANIFFEDGVLEINSKNIGYFDFKSSAIDDYLYNLMFFLEFEQKTLMGSFTCLYKDSNEWRDIVFEILNTIKVENKEE